MALRTGSSRSRTEKAEPMTGRTRAALAVGAGTLAAVTLGVGALASSPPASAKSVKAITIKKVSVPKLGTVLATNSGLTLYRFTVDPAGKATCTGACAKVWPPLLLPKGVSHIKAPHGVKGFSLGRVTGGRLQVFFHHQALYTFVSDKKGEATGQGVENDWFAVLSNGKSSALISASTPNSTTTPAAPSSSTTTTTKTPAAATKTPTTTAPKTTTPTSTSNSGSAPAAPVMPPVTQPTAPPTTQPPTTTTTQPPTTTTTAPPSSGYGY
jgi:predicted lipoprotein with Yx(FWY)xxD motif